MGRWVEKGRGSSLGGHITMYGCSRLETNGDIELEIGDYDAALDGFTPAALQNVNLHQAGDQGWEAVGGLKQVRDTLLQTLMWPSKVLYKCCIFNFERNYVLYSRLWLIFTITEIIKSLIKFILML